MGKRAFPPLPTRPQLMAVYLALLICFETNGQLQTDKMDTHAGIQNETAETTFVENMNMQL